MDRTSLSFDPADKRLGARLRQRRLELGLSQTVVAKALEISFQQLRKYESGANRVTASRLLALADVFQVSISYFFDPVPTQSGKADEMSEPPSAESWDRILNRSFVKIKSPKVRKQIIEIIEAIARNAE